MEPFSWQCPFCNRDATITEEDHRSEIYFFTAQNASGPRAVFLAFVVCPNRKCRKFTFTVALYEAERDAIGRLETLGKFLNRWDLIPPSAAKAFPDYIPKAIIEDYNEACLIKDLSPKASATLARRCLQGIIRDFWGVSKARLIDEIDAIKDKVDPLTWKAIDAVRGVGNIGAHMEKDINLIIEVEPEEAAQLIGLIELLVRDWYITHHEREERLKAIVTLGDKKERAKKQGS